eukprot:UN24574
MPGRNRKKRKKRGGGLQPAVVVFKTIMLQLTEMFSFQQMLKTKNWYKDKMTKRLVLRTLIIVQEPSPLHDSEQQNKSSHVVNNSLPIRNTVDSIPN